MRVARLFLAPTLAFGIGLPLATMVVTDNALRVPERNRPSPNAASAITRATGAACRDVQIRAADGVPLSAWLFTPKHPNRALVIVLHGVADNRRGMVGHASFLLNSGFTVLTPDSRGHGASGGTLITYGVKEAGDLHAWVDWAFRTLPVERLYGLGVSMGAAVLLQSLACEPRFRAVVAECPFATFEEISYDRMRQITGLPRALVWPVVQSGFLYTRARYGIDLRKASPVEAIRSTRVPILLIHGTADSNIPIRHSAELHAANPSATTLWTIDGAEHVQGLATAPEQYAATVTRWFTEH